MRIIIRKQLMICVAVVLCLALALTGGLASASSAGNARMILIMMYGEESLPGINVNIYRVATVSAGVRVAYELIDPEFTGAADELEWDGELKDIAADELKALADLLMAYVDDQGIEPLASGVTDENGIVAFNGLETGLYLVSQGEPSVSRHIFSGALVPVIIEGETVHVFPKTELPELPPPPDRNRPQRRPRPPQDEEVVEVVEPPEVPLVNPPAGPPQEIPDVPIDLPPIPGDPMPPGGLPQTGITNWDIIIAILLAIGVVLVTIGLVQLRRSRSKEQSHSEELEATEQQ